MIEIFTTDAATHQYRLTDESDRLTRRWRREVHGQVGQPKDAHEWRQAVLADKLAAVVVRRVVAKNRLDKLHLSRRTGKETQLRKQIGASMYM